MPVDDVKLRATVKPLVVKDGKPVFPTRLVFVKHEVSCADRKCEGC